MTNTMTLEQHLNAIMTKTLAWVAEAPESRWACYPTQDLAYWNEQGIFTVAQYERDQLEGAVWDLYKEVHGVRPRFMDFKAMTVAELEATISGLHETAKWMAEQEAKWEEQAKAEEAWQTELQAHERSLNPDGELFWKDGFWQVPA